MFSFSKAKDEQKYGKIKLFSGAISRGVSSEHLRWSILGKMLNGYKPLTIFVKKLHHRCLTWF